jgi:hypothetical protein
MYCTYIHKTLEVSPKSVDFGRRLDAIFWGERRRQPIHLTQSLFEVMFQSFFVPAPKARKARAGFEVSPPRLTLLVTRETCTLSPYEEYYPQCG